MSNERGNYVVTQERPVNRNGTGITNPSDPRNLAYLRDAEQRIKDALSQMAHADAVRTEKRQSQRRLQRALTDIADEMQLDVATAATPDGKPRFTNAEARGAALKRALREHPTVQALQEQIDGLDIDLSEQEVIFETARRQKSADVALLDFAGKWLGYWTTNNTEEHSR